MSMTLSASTKKITPAAIELINSLGGPELSLYQSNETLQVSLENLSSAQTPVWSLNVLEQALRHYQAPKPVASVKENPYMSR